MSALGLLMFPITLFRTWFGLHAYRITCRVSVLINTHIHMYAVQVPVLSLSPAPDDTDYFYHLDDKEGLLDLYDLSRTTSAPRGQTALPLSDSIIS